MKRFLLILCILCIWLPVQMTTMHAEEEEPTLEIESKIAYVYNLETDTSIYEKNADEVMYPASMTKIMTVYTALQYIEDMEQPITLQEKVFEGLTASNASVAGFNVYDEVSVEDLLYAIMLPSGAEACRAIAIYIAGSEEGFVTLMNEQASKLGLTNTHFANTTGLHDDEHYTTAKEMAIILKEAIKNENFFEIFTTQTYQTQPLASNADGISMQSTMWKYLDQIQADTSLFMGGKTGFTLEAGHCLASLSTKLNDAQYITVTAQGEGTFQDTIQVEDAQRIYTYLQEYYEYRTLYNKGDKVVDIPVKRLIGTSTITYTAQEDIAAVVRIGDEITAQFQSEEALQEPIKEGEEIGEIVLSGKYGEVTVFTCYANTTLYNTKLIMGIFIVVILIVFFCWFLIKRKKQIKRRVQLRTMRSRDQVVFDVLQGMNKKRKD